MDINSILKNTINSLSEPHHINAHKSGELNIIEVNNIKGDREVSTEDVESVMGSLNKAARNVDSRVSFSYHEKTKRILMRITDPVTREVVKQIPSREMIRILENIHDLVGMFVDEQV